MPPVRWKLLTVVTICCYMESTSWTDAQMMQDAISMTSDGWRPIVGTRKEPIINYLEFRHNSEIKSETSTLPPTQTLPLTMQTTPLPPQKIVYRTSTKPTHIQGRKKSGLSKPSQLNPFFALPTHGSHGPHIPIGAVTHGRPGQVGQIKKYPTSSKPFIQVSTKGKRTNFKPTRVQTSTTHSNDLHTASAMAGAYSFFKHSNNIKTRETLGLGLPVSNHYSINPPHAHVEFMNRFALPSNSDSIYQQYSTPLQTFIISKNPQTNDVNYQFQNQNDEYTRNLVPPPLLYTMKDAKIKENEVKPDSVIVQLPPPFQYNTQKNNERPVQVQVTKEKLNVFSPQNFEADYVDYDFHSVKKPSEISKLQTYEVTEGNLWHDTPPYSKPQLQVELNVPPFLPTPFRPEGQAILPTSPTQSEISTIFTKLTKIQREKENTTPNPFGYHAKEVSTHYPILGKPLFNSHSQEISNEITTKLEEEVVTMPPSRRPHRRRRPDRHRTTTSTTTTTEEPTMDHYESSRTQISDTSDSMETERPLRRRPNRHRTTTPTVIMESEEYPMKVTRSRNRHRHRITTESNYEPVIRKRGRPSRLEIVTELPENYKTESEENISEKSVEIEDSEKIETVAVQLNGRHYVTEPTTTEKAPTTNQVIIEEENELTSNPVEETTTVVTTTTTTAPTTTSSPPRIRRPIKYDNSNRPRFSVKDYRLKLSQYSSTQPPDVYKTTESHQVRLPSRMRRPTSSSTTTPSTREEDNTNVIRSKFTPKEPRHSSTTTDDAIITEKTVKSVNTRLRPFSRFRSTSATTTTTPRVSIKPNLFTRRRPPMLTLKSKIYNKYNKNNNNTEATTTEESVNETTMITEEPVIEEKVVTVTNNKNSENDEEITTTLDILKNDASLYTQRVSDLTSSFKNEYDTPGLFKSVSPTSRRIPNYFTIATDDPILPIEAFFPSIKEKMKEKEFRNGKFAAATVGSGL